MFLVRKLLLLQSGTGMVLVRRYALGIGYAAPKMTDKTFEKTMGDKKTEKVFKFVI